VDTAARPTAGSVARALLRRVAGGRTVPCGDDDLCSGDGDDDDRRRRAVARPVVAS
jgi:hypothetical protein